MLNFWIASGNPSKAKELVDFAAEYFPNAFIKVHSAKNVIENERTFLGNAKLKALALVDELLSNGHKDFVVLGDDSGLSVDLLDGKPGIYSARYSGADANSKRNLDKLLCDLGKITNDLTARTGKYICALHLIKVNNGKIIGEYSSEGVRDGLIAIAVKGTNGYAYDSIFLDPKTRKSYGELSYGEKQRDSHRRRAFEGLVAVIG